mgnify:CR=1 FL=1
MGEIEQAKIIRIARESGEEISPEPIDLASRVRELRRAQGIETVESAL